MRKDLKNGHFPAEEYYRGFPISREQKKYCFDWVCCSVIQLQTLRINGSARLVLYPLQNFAVIDMGWTFLLFIYANFVRFEFSFVSAKQSKIIIFVIIVSNGSSSSSSSSSSSRDSIVISIIIIIIITILYR